MTQHNLVTAGNIWYNHKSKSGFEIIKICAIIRWIALIMTSQLYNK